MYTTIISCQEAFLHLNVPSWVFVDCRYSLSDKTLGYSHYLESHLPRAVYADLEQQMSGPVIPGVTGRHPLPDKRSLVSTFRKLGIGPGSQVVVYDEKTGSMAASRLWWLLKWAGHSAVAVLDGGLQEWKQTGYPLTGGLQENAPAEFVPQFEDDLICSSEEVQRAAADSNFLLIDSRTRDRYRGENEVIDPVAGHIPGAVSLPFVENLTENGLLMPRETLQKRFAAVAGALSPHNTIFYCGSGVTAAQNILSFVHAGNAMPRLYAGSWSEWITDARKPVAIGENK